jgi:hypothetical protein
MTITTSYPHFTGLYCTTDLVNGLAITLTSSDKTFDYTEAFLVLSGITRVLHNSIDITKIETIDPKRKPPTQKDIESSLLLNQLVIAYSIAPNQNHHNFHIHGYIYGLSNHKKDIKTWTSYVEYELKKLIPFSRKNRYSIVMKPVYDPIDMEIRESNSYDSLAEYLSNPHYDTFLHYLVYHNNGQILYSYA